MRGNNLVISNPPETLDELLENVRKVTTNKDQAVRLQIDYNKTAPGSEVIMPDGTKIIDKVLIAVDSYSTRFVYPDDQFLLAVDKVAYPEVKSGLYTFDYLHKGDPLFPPDKMEGIDVLGTEFSLNGGDKRALGILLRAFPNTKTQYSYRVLVKSIYSGTFDETSTFRSIGKPGRPNSAVELEKQMLNFVSIMRILCRNTVRSNDKIQFEFDVFCDGCLSGNPDIPDFSSAFIVRRDDQKPQELVWSYVIMLHLLRQADQKVKTEDALMKSVFEPSKVLVRTALADLGLYPEHIDTL